MLFINKITKNKKILFWLFLVIILLRFVWLNYINWQTGAISNGEPGVKLWHDSYRFIEGANRMINHSNLIGRESQFIGYISIIAILKSFSLSLKTLILFQIFVAILAAISIIDICKQISKSYIPGFVSIALFMGNPFIVKWHQYVLTESLYTSFVIFCFWILVKLRYQKSFSNYLLSFFILLITVLLRPNGWILVPVFFLFYIDDIPINKYAKIIFIAFLFVIVSMIAVFYKPLQQSINITTPVENLKNGVTVWEMYDLYIDMPEEPELEANDWKSGLIYVAKNPMSSMKLALVRCYYTLIHIRPNHSSLYKLNVLI